MDKAIPLPQASALFEWRAISDNEEPTNEGEQPPVTGYEYVPRQSVVKPLESKLRQYFPGKQVVYDPVDMLPGEDIEEDRLLSIEFTIGEYGTDDYYHILIVHSYNSDNGDHDRFVSEFKSAIKPSSPPEEREALKAKMDTHVRFSITKMDFGEPTQKEFDDVFKMVMNIADNILENPMGGRRKKRKTKRRGRKRSTRKKLRR